MNVIRKLCMFTILVLLLSACGAHAPAASVEPPAELSIEPTGESNAGVIFTYNGKDYDLQEREFGVNALMSETAAGSFIVVEGHIGPHNGYYGIFDTKTETFVKDITGSHLTWRADDISTAVYNFWSEIYSYDGSLLAALDLSETEYISDLSWKDSQRLSVEIQDSSNEDRRLLEVTVGEGTTQYEPVEKE